MAIPGNEIYRCYDEWGPVRVFEQGTRRYLAFGEDTEQGCVDLLEPAHLVYEYTQAMMLVLLYQTSPKQVAVLGLGVGSLVRSLQHYDPLLKLSVVELRPQVAEVAEHWFCLTPSPSVSMHFGDAGRYMAVTKSCSDIIFSDIYTDTGMVETQLSEAFLEDCYDRLTDEGVLVLNLWEERQGLDPGAVQALWNQFGDGCLCCPVVDGNVIVFAFKGDLPELTSRRLLSMAKKLGRRLNAPLFKLIGRLKTL